MIDMDMLQCSIARWMESVQYQGKRERAKEQGSRSRVKKKKSLDLGRKGAAGSKTDDETNR